MSKISFTVEPDAIRRLQQKLTELSGRDAIEGAEMIEALEAHFAELLGIRLSALTLTRVRPPRVLCPLPYWHKCIVHIIHAVRCLVCRAGMGPGGAQRACVGCQHCGRDGSNARGGRVRRWAPTQRTWPRTAA